MMNSPRRNANTSIKVVGTKTLSGEIQTYMNSLGREENSTLLFDVLKDGVSSVRQLILTEVDDNLTGFDQIQLIVTGEDDEVRIQGVKTQRRDDNVRSSGGNRMNNVGREDTTRIIKMKKDFLPKLKSLVAHLVDDFINVFWEFGRSLTTNGSINFDLHERNLRVGKKAVVRFLEEFVTFMEVSAVLFNHLDEITFFDQIRSMSGEILLRVVKRRDAQGVELPPRKIPSAQLKMKTLISVELYKSLRVRIYEDSRVEGDGRDNRQVKKILEFSDVVSVRNFSPKGKTEPVTPSRVEKSLSFPSLKQKDDPPVKFDWNRSMDEDKLGNKLFSYPIGSVTLTLKDNNAQQFASVIKDGMSGVKRGKLIDGATEKVMCRVGKVGELLTRIGLESSRKLSKVVLARLIEAIEALI